MNKKIILSLLMASMLPLSVQAKRSTVRSSMRDLRNEITGARRGVMAVVALRRVRVPRGYRIEIRRVPLTGDMVLFLNGRPVMRDDILEMLNPER